MKKFVFRLEPLVRVKKTAEKQQKAALASAQEVYRDLERRRDEIVNQAARVNSEFQKELSSGINGLMLMYYGQFFEDSKKAIDRKEQEMVYANIRVEECREALVQTMRELKTYKKLHDAQYAEYLKEVQAEIDKEIGDLISYKAAVI